jgi:endoglucanase
MDQTAELLKAITEADGVPGYESEVRAIMREYLEDVAEIKQDKMGSLIGSHAGAGEDAPRVMLAGHMDEIGFMVRHITKEGYIKFIPLGGWWDQVLLGHRVRIKTSQGDVIGVLGAKPPHLLEADEAKKIVEKKAMYIDVGARSEEEVREFGVRPGDPIIPVSDFTIMANPSFYLCKAFDNRLGCALAMEALRATAPDHPNTVYAVGTVQEEIGLRGARTTAYAIDPDVAIVLEVDIAGDVPGIKPEESSVKMGGGPTMLIYDRSMIPNLKLRDLVIATAEELEIPLQFSAMSGGATDGGPIHLHNEGVPTVVIGVPTRHIHSHNAMICREDYDQALALVVALVKKLDAETVAGLTA